MSRNEFVVRLKRTPLPPVPPAVQPSEPLPGKDGKDGRDGLVQVVHVGGGVGPAGPPGPAGGASFLFTQATPSASWVVVHNLNTLVNVTVLNSAQVIVETDVAETDLNTTTISFSTPQTGYALIGA